MRRSPVTAALLRLLEAYGAEELQAAITESLAQGVPHPNAVRMALERRREQRHQPPPLPVRLNHERAKDLVVRPHNLADYDPAQSPSDEPEDSTQDEH